MFKQKINLNQIYSESIQVSELGQNAYSLSEAALRRFRRGATSPKASDIEIKSMLGELNTWANHIHDNFLGYIDIENSFSLDFVGLNDKYRYWKRVTLDHSIYTVLIPLGDSSFSLELRKSKYSSMNEVYDYESVDHVVVQPGEAVIVYNLLPEVEMKGQMIGSGEVIEIKLLQEVKQHV